MRRLLFFSSFILTVASVAAQKDTIRLRDIARSQKSIVTDRPPQAVYFQLGGSAPLLSVNYDRRFSKKVNGPGFAAGLGYFGESGISIFSVPVSLNYLFGRNSHFMELAAGGTYVSAAGDLFDFEEAENSIFIFHINLGYRYQPSRGGFFFRGGISPLFAQSEYATSYYLGFGHNF
jgi:hypothetical protein